MSSLELTVKQSTASQKKFFIEIDAKKFEKMAALFGFFNPDFLKSLDRAENDYRRGRVENLKSLKDLR